MPRAFTATKTKNVVLNFVKGLLTIVPESFKGLEEIAILDLSSEKSTITLDNDTFICTPKLEALTMTLNEATTTLSNKFETLEELKKLIILGGQLEIIKNDTFTSANNKLRHVQISSCSIFFIEPKTFANLTDLWYLDLSNNSLMRIAPGTFDGLSNLEVLKLQKNNIYKIKESTLNDLVNLYRFDICDNDLTEISNEIFYNTKIEYLYLRNNRLKIIQKELFNYTNSTLIKEIDLQNNYIDRIEKGAFAGLNLDVLDLAKNKLQVITNGIFQGCLGILELNISVFVASNDYCEKQENVKICKFQNILISVKLGEYDTTISDESISWIIPYAFKETRTKTLSLNFAKGLLTIEPECFKGLEQITTLDLSSEKSTIILNNDTFLYTPKLQTLVFTLNEATTTLSNKFETLKNLIDLVILGGHLEILKNDTFTSANEKLNSLKISSCSIFSIEPKTFAKLTELGNLDLSNNSLMRITPGTFDGLSKLETLNLENNNIYKIKEATLNELVSLYDFDIHDNDLTDMSNDTFYNTKSQNLYLQNNRLKIIRKELFNYTNSKLIQRIYLQNNYIDRIDEGAFAGLQLYFLDISNNKLKVIQPKMFKGCSTIDKLDISGNNISKIVKNTFKDIDIGRIIISRNDQLERPDNFEFYWGLSSSTKIEWK
ncbi:hypothetical protein HCN44_007629 [Aphidius gifuensis]|uniref:Chaoptin n=1 Tax=Aphidius gifuensis TaxID=684658 RepID=A0A834XMT5_APHGI|nr:hypothetical protein HCN44_007629 [Aphidius gifuensis]